MLHGGCGHNSGTKVWARTNPLKRNWHLSCHHDLLICLSLWKILGPSGLASTERDLPIRDKVGWSECCGLCQPPLHSIDSTVFSCVAVSSQIRNFLAIWRINYHHE